MGVWKQVEPTGSLEFIPSVPKQFRVANGGAWITGYQDDAGRSCHAYALDQCRTSTSWWVQHDELDKALCRLVAVSIGGDGSDAFGQPSFSGTGGTVSDGGLHRLYASHMGTHLSERKREITDSRVQIGDALSPLGLRNNPGNHGAVHLMVDLEKSTWRCPQQRATIIEP
jgi:hypothetical protein